MKNHTITIIVLLWLLTFLLVACSGGNQRQATSCQGYTPMQPPIIKEPYYTGAVYPLPASFLLPAKSALILETHVGGYTDWVRWAVLRNASSQQQRLPIPDFVSADELTDSILVPEQNWKSELEWRVAQAVRRQDTLVGAPDGLTGRDVVQLYGLNPCVLEQQ